MGAAAFFDVSKETGELLVQHRHAAKVRQAEMIRLLRSDVGMAFLNEGVREAVFVRGSLARGDFCSRSDVDLVVLTDRRKAVVSHDLRRRLEWIECSIGRQISADCWNEKTCEDRSYGLGFWLTAFEARVLAGDTEFFVGCRLRWLNRMAKIPVSAMFEMRSQDLRRHWNIRQRQSPLGMNVKRAEGGLIDGDFVKLLKDRAGRNARISGKLQELFDKSELVHDHLFLVKSLLHDLKAAPRESALLECDAGQLPRVLRRDNVACLLDSQQELIEQLKEKLQC